MSCYTFTQKPIGVKEEHMNRNQVLKIAEAHLLPTIRERYGLADHRISAIEPHEGGRNLFYFCENEGENDKIIRIVFLPDRNIKDIQSELEFVQYLSTHDGRVSNLIDSQNGQMVEELSYQGQLFFISVFEKAKGQQLADNGYRYREGAPLSEYFYNCGKTLGQLHELSKEYQPIHRRYSFFDKYNPGFITRIIPESLPLLKGKLLALHQTLAEMERDPNNYGLIHFDYSDGNYMIDYETGDITVFDFDNACYCWYMVDLANVWKHGVGWIQYESNVDKRRQFMTEYFATVLEGYRSETAIDERMLERLPLFINLNVMENIIDAFEVMQNNGEKPECDEELSYLIKCVEDDIPYVGFFHDIYAPDKPFECDIRTL